MGKHPCPERVALRDPLKRQVDASPPHTHHGAWDRGPTLCDDRGERKGQLSGKESGTSCLKPLGASPLEDQGLGLRGEEARWAL